MTITEKEELLKKYSFVRIDDNERNYKLTADCMLNYEDWPELVSNPATQRNSFISIGGEEFLNRMRCVLKSMKRMCEQQEERIENELKEIKEND